MLLLWCSDCYIRVFRTYADCVSNLGLPVVPLKVLMHVYMYVYSFQRPTQRLGITEIIANDRGHLRTGIPRDPSSPWGSFVGTWQAEIKPPVLMTKTKLVNPRTIVKSPPCTAVAKESKPVSVPEDNKSSSPTAEDDKSRSGSPAKSISLKSTKPPSPTASKVEDDKSRSGSPAKPLSTKPSSPAASKVEEASNKTGSPTTKPMSPTPKSVVTTPVSVRNDNMPVDQVTTPVKPSTPQETSVTGNNATVTTVQSDNRLSSKPVVTPDTSSKPASVASPPKDAVVTTPQ